MKAKIIQVNKSKQNTTDPVHIVFDVIDEDGKIVVHNQNCHFSSFVLDQISDKKQFIFRTINDLMRDIYREKISDVAITDSDIKIGDEIQHDESQPPAEEALIPLDPPKIEDAKSFLKMVDLSQLNNVNDLKVVLGKILIIFGFKN